MKTKWIGLLGCLFALVLPAQEPITLKYSNPDKPGHLEIGLVRGSIQVDGHDGDEIVVENLAHQREGKIEVTRKDGLRIINVATYGMTVEEDNNRLQVAVDSPHALANIKVRVPRRTSVELATVNEGTITVTGLIGDLEVTNVNGSISLTEVEGSAVVDTVNGQIKVVFTKVTAQRALSFSTLNGDIDVTFPEGTKGRIRLETHRGEVYSNMDLEFHRELLREDSDDRGSSGRRIRISQVLMADLNGGGPTFAFNSVNGNIFIRKRE